MKLLILFLASLLLLAAAPHAGAQPSSLTLCYGPPNGPPGARAPRPCTAYWGDAWAYAPASPLPPYPEALPGAPAASWQAQPGPSEAPSGPPPLGWVFGPYTSCGDPPRCSVGVVSVGADGLNVRASPDGPPVMALVNGTPLLPLGREGRWLLVAAACDLTPTFAWSWTAGVPLNRCWVW